jgi:GNAT superfamily N-acetyltransferase
VPSPIIASTPYYFGVDRNFIIRRYRPTDQPAIEALYGRVQPYRPEDEASVESMHARAAMAQRTGDRWAPLTHGPDTLDDVEGTYAAFWVAEIDGTIAGIVGALRGVIPAISSMPGGDALRARTDVVELRRLRVAPEHRRCGIGAALTSEVVDWARSARYASLLLNTTSAQAPARALYERMGFRQIGAHFLGELEIIWYEMKL